MTHVIATTMSKMCLALAVLLITGCSQQKPIGGHASRFSGSLSNQTATLVLERLDCSLCADHLAQCLTNLDGVVMARIDLQNRRIALTLAPQQTLERADIDTLIAREGFVLRAINEP